MRKYSLLFLVVVLMGCASARYVPSVALDIPEVPTHPVVYFSDTNVPYVYEEMGRIFMHQSNKSKYDRLTQIRLILQEAGRIGAEGVIIRQMIGQRSEAAFVGNFGGGSTDSVFEVEGIAIRKKQ